MSPRVIDPIRITGHTYRVSFKDTLENLRFDVYDVDNGEYVVQDGDCILFRFNV
jgi:hypothetical protein